MVPQVLQDCKLLVAVPAIPLGRPFNHTHDVGRDHTKLRQLLTLLQDVGSAKNTFQITQSSALISSSMEKLSVVDKTLPLDHFV